MNTVNDHLDTVLATVRKLPGALEEFREMLLANLVMLGEIPAPTFGEEKRLEFLKQRFTECGLQNVSSDEAGNALGIYPGSPGKKSILVTAHADTPFPDTLNHTLALDMNRVVGPGVGNNSVGLAVLATLPTLMERLDIRLKADIVLMGATRALGRGNLGGLRFFLAHNQLPLVAGIDVESTRLGRLHYTSPASLGGEITCRVGEREDFTGAVEVLLDVIGRLRAIELPQETQTRLILGEVEAGTSFKSPARCAALRFQVRSTSDQSVHTVAEQIDTLADEVAEDTGASVEFEVIARAQAGGLEPGHPLVLEARRTMTALGIQPQEGCCSSAVSSFTEQGVPALCIGITSGRNANQRDEEVDTAPIMRGVAQLIGILMAMDGGCCD
jgi:acetylornithine deacetylase/succinyl-diaminopimelate desuccinylase-like protein